jgi:hypothetical protein
MRDALLIVMGAATLLNTVVIKRMLDAHVEPVPVPRDDPALTPFPRFP